MLKVSVETALHYTTDNLTQWDKDHSLELTGVTFKTTPAVHFANKKSAKALVVAPKLESGVLTVDIPNSLLQFPYPILAYVYSLDDNSGTTTLTIAIPVTPRVQPDEYVFTGDKGLLTLAEINSKVTQKLIELDGRVNDTLTEANNKLNQALADTQTAVNAALNRIPSEDQPLPISRGGFGGTTAEAARANLEITPKNIGAVTMRKVTFTDTGMWTKDKSTGKTTTGVYLDGVTAEDTIILIPASDSNTVFNTYNVCIDRQEPGYIGLSASDYPTQILTITAVILS